MQSFNSNPFRHIKKQKKPTQCDIFSSFHSNILQVMYPAQTFDYNEKYDINRGCLQFLNLYYLETIYFHEIRIFSIFSLGCF